MNAKQKWLDAGEKVDVSRANWRNLDRQLGDCQASGLAWMNHRITRDAEALAYNEFIASMGGVYQ